MSMPVKMTAKQFKRLQKNLNTPYGHSNKSVDVSMMLTALWEAWELGKGRRRTIEDVNQVAPKLLFIARKYTKGKRNAKEDRR
jgi:hypothetical protein